MKKFEGILLCTDLDGTLLGSDRSVSKENFAAIDYFKSNGGRFTFVTGRAPTTAAKMYEMVHPNAAIGCFNGGGVYDFETDAFLRFQELDREALELVAAVDRELPDVGIQVNGARHIYFNKENSAQKTFRRITGVPHLTCHFTEVQEPMAKVLLLHEDNAVILEVAALLAAHPLASKYDFIRSEPTLYEILPKDVSKGGALLQLAEIYGIDPKRTVAVGDYDNDVSMLLAAGVGIAVENASEAAKRAADLVTVSNDAHAIAKIINDIDTGRIVL